MQLKQIFVVLAEPATAEPHAEPTSQLVAFYQGLFQQAPSVCQPGYAEFTLPGLRLGIFRPKAAHQAEFQAKSQVEKQGGAGSISLCLEVAQLEAAIERLRSLGYPPTGEVVVASHGREIYAYDPAGNRLILHEAKTL
jgi:predicted enzyme related to lactoylglutathione lyase